MWPGFVRKLYTECALSRVSVCVCVSLRVCLCTTSAPWGPLFGWVSVVAVITLLTTIHSKPDLARLFCFLYPSSCTQSSSPLAPNHLSTLPPSLLSPFSPSLFSPPPTLHRHRLPFLYFPTPPFLISSFPFVVMAVDWWSLFSFNYTAGEWPGLFMPVKQKTQLG